MGKVKFEEGFERGGIEVVLGSVPDLRGSKVGRAELSKESGNLWVAENCAAPGMKVLDWNILQ